MKNAEVRGERYGMLKLNHVLVKVGGGLYSLWRIPADQQNDQIFCIKTFTEVMIICMYVHSYSVSFNIHNTPDTKFTES